MFEDQMVELLPARTTMSNKKCRPKKYCSGGNNTAVAVNSISVSERGPGDQFVFIIADQDATATAG